MKTLRWLAFIPVSVVLAVASSFGIGDLFPSRSFSRKHVLLSIVSPYGLAPQIIERLAPLVIFVVVGTVIAPVTGRKIVIILGVLGGICGWPFGPQYSMEYGHIFYLASAAGTLTGCALGMLVGFDAQAWRRKRKSNQSTQPDAHDTSVIHTS